MEMDFYLLLKLKLLLKLINCKLNRLLILLLHKKEERNKLIQINKIL